MHTFILSLFGFFIALLVVLVYRGQVGPITGLGLAFLLPAVLGIATSYMVGAGTIVHRKRNPVFFWIYFVLYALIGAIIIYIGVTTPLPGEGGGSASLTLSSPRFS